MIPRCLLYQLALVHPGTASEIPREMALRELASLFWRGMSRCVPQRSPPVAWPILARPKLGIWTSGAWLPKQHDMCMHSLPLCTCARVSRTLGLSEQASAQCKRPSSWGPRLLPQHSWCRVGKVVWARPVWPCARKVDWAPVGVRSPECLSSADSLALLRNF